MSGNTYRFADVTVRIESIHPMIHQMCSGYVWEGEADMEIKTDQSDIDFERSRSLHSEGSDAYLETLAVYRKIAEKMPEYDTFLFHGSAISVEGQAYIFAARSGTGKSTHARLWREMLGDQAVMVNDDKPLIKVLPDNTAIVYGTPWNGKHHLSSNIQVPVKAVCLLERSGQNEIRAISREEAMPRLMQQAYRPFMVPALEKTLELLSRMNVKYYRLGCNMDISAAELAYKTMA